MAELSGQLVGPSIEWKTASRQFILHAPGYRNMADLAAVTYRLDDVCVVSYTKAGGQIGLVDDHAFAYVWDTSPAQSIASHQTGMDHTLYNWVIFYVPGYTALFAVRESQWQAVVAACNALTLDCVGLIYSLPTTMQPFQPSALTHVVPTPPVVVVTPVIPSGGGEVFQNPFGSNPYTWHFGYDVTKTRVMNMLMKLFNGSNMGSFNPPPSHGPTSGTTWLGTDWQCWDQDSYAMANATWTAPWQMGDGPGHWDIWQAFGGSPAIPIEGAQYHAPAHGLIVPGYGFDPLAIWDVSPPRGNKFIRSNTTTYDYGASPNPLPGTAVDHCQDLILIRGKLVLPPRPPDTLTAIILNYNNGEAGYTDLDSWELNKNLWSDPSNQGRPSVTNNTRKWGFQTWDWTSTAGLWRWNADNLICMSVVGQYGFNVEVFPGGDHTGAATWIDVAFTFDNGTHYGTVPADWQTTTGGQFVPTVLGPPGSYFGRGVTNSDDLGNIGAAGRAYYHKQFAIPDVPIHGGVLAITAETGIGSIWINGNRVDLGAQQCDETIDLWDTHTTLTFTIPAAFFRRNDTTNELAVQVYSSTGPAVVIYLLDVY